ncbi:MAG: hypothetical protein HN732_17700, partial [Rhodospirillaceae bacterium]|nr:hypothetical protein [Rhodospirillaceae bacterium]
MPQVLNSPLVGGVSGRLKAWWNGDETPAGKAGGKLNGNAAAEAEEEVIVYPSPSGIAEWTPQRI